MELDALILARMQFAFTVAFHIPFDLPSTSPAAPRLVAALSQARAPEAHPRLTRRTKSRWAPV